MKHSAEAVITSSGRNLQAGILAQVSVVTSLLLGWLLIGDRLTGLQWLGCGLGLGVVVGVLTLQAAPRATF